MKMTSVKAARVRAFLAASIALLVVAAVLPSQGSANLKDCKLSLDGTTNLNGLPGRGELTGNIVTLPSDTWNFDLVFLCLRPPPNTPGQTKEYSPQVSGPPGSGIRVNIGGPDYRITVDERFFYHKAQVFSTPKGTWPAELYVTEPLVNGASTETLKVVVTPPTVDPRAVSDALLNEVGLGAPKGKFKAKGRVVTGSFEPKPHVDYMFDARKLGGKGIRRASCRRLIDRIVCSARLTKGRWEVSVTPRMFGTIGIATRTVLRVR